MVRKLLNKKLFHSQLFSLARSWYLYWRFPDLLFLSFALPWRWQIYHTPYRLLFVKILQELICWLRPLKVIVRVPFFPSFCWTRSIYKCFPLYIFTTFKFFPFLVILFPFIFIVIALSSPRIINGWKIPVAFIVMFFYHTIHCQILCYPWVYSYLLMAWEYRCSVI